MREQHGHTRGGVRTPTHHSWHIKKQVEYLTEYKTYYDLHRKMNTPIQEGND